MIQPAHKLRITTIAMLAMLCAQVFGLQRGYLCECGGVSHLSQFDHCHGHHHGHDDESAGKCHDHDEIDPGHSLAEHHRGCGDSAPHEHQPSIEELTAQKTAGQQAHIAATVADAPVIAVLEAPRLPSFAFRDAPGSCGTGPPVRQRWPAMLARTIVLLI